MGMFKKQKQKKELRQHLSTRQLMGIEKLTEHGVLTVNGELEFYLIKPDNLSVLSDDGVHGRILALTNLLRSTDGLCLLALDSRESFQGNKDYYHRRLENEELPALRELLRQDAAHLDEIQSSTASSREFVMASFTEEGDAGQTQLLEKRIRDCGFHVRLADTQDVMRLLAVYYQQDVTTEFFESFDGEGWID